MGGFSVFGDSSHYLWNFFTFFFWWLPLQNSKYRVGILGTPPIVNIVLFSILKNPVPTLLSPVLCCLDQSWQGPHICVSEYQWFSVSNLEHNNNMSHKCKFTLSASKRILFLNFPQFFWLIHPWVLLCKYDPNLKVLLWILVGNIDTES